MNYYIYGYTDKGQYRLKNEDAMLVNRVAVAKKRGGFGSVCINPFLTAICDGVGGEKAGDLASKLCAESLGELDFDSGTDLDSQILAIHRKLREIGVKTDSTANMQTTLCMLAVDEDGTATCYNIGDSRMYRYVKGSVRQVSVDQTYARFLYEQGAITSASEVAPEYRHAITSSVGSGTADPKIEHVRFVTQFGEEEDDTVLICSDGLSDFITRDEIEIAMKINSMTFSEKLEALCQLAMRNGSTDNVSVIGIKPWNTPEQYCMLTGTSLFNSKDPEVVRAQQECLEYQERYENQKLEQQADDLLASLRSDLEKFKAL